MKKWDWSLHISDISDATPDIEENIPSQSNDSANGGVVHSGIMTKISGPNLNGTLAYPIRYIFQILPGDFIDV